MFCFFFFFYVLQKLKIPTNSLHEETIGGSKLVCVKITSPLSAKTSEWRRQDRIRFYRYECAVARLLGRFVLETPEIDWKKQWRIRNSRQFTAFGWKTMWNNVTSKVARARTKLFRIEFHLERPHQLKSYPQRITCRHSHRSDLKTNFFYPRLNSIRPRGGHATDRTRAKIAKIAKSHPYRKCESNVEFFTFFFFIGYDDLLFRWEFRFELVVCVCFSTDTRSMSLSDEKKIFFFFLNTFFNWILRGF